MNAQTHGTLLMIYVFVVGACVGSFLNVVIYRLPRGMSLVSPRSACPECGSMIRGWDNIPLLSWPALMGLCVDCGVRIPARYFLVELVTAGLTLGIVSEYGLNVQSALYCALAWVLIAASFIDMEYQIIPDELSVGAIIVGVLAAPFTALGFGGAMLGLGVGGGIFFILAIAYPGGMGGGDIKLMGGIGAFTGWKLSLLTIVTGSILGATAGVVGLLLLGKTRKDRIPFGPFLALGAVLSILWGDKFIAFYLKTIVLN